MNQNIKKILKGTAIAALAAGITFAGPELMQISYSFDWNGATYDLSPIVYAIVAAGINIVKVMAKL